MSQESDNNDSTIYSSQEDLILMYEEKWNKLTFSTSPIERQKAAESIKNLYVYINKSEPNIIFFSSPYIALKAIFTELKERAGSPLSKNIHELNCSLDSLLKFGRPFTFIEGYLTYMQLVQQLERELNTRFSQYEHEVNPFTVTAIQPELWTESAAFSECLLFREEAKDPLWEREERISLSLFENCGWIFPFENICIVCDRPCKLSLDNQHRLHAEGEPAIQFADGYSLYSYHGELLPEQYGKIHPNNWQAKWILSERNAEVRRVLIQIMGYARILQEFDAVEINSYQEYSLLKITNDVDLEPIHLLKMTCPSTGKIHALRVPPDIKSARQAIRWVNWGIDPEDFAMQT